MKKNSQYASLDNVQISKKHIEHKYYNKRPIRGYRVSNIQSNFERDNAPLYNTIQTEVNNSKNIFNNNFSSGKYTPYINRDNVYRDYYQMHTYQPNESEEIKDFSKTSMHLNPFSLFSQSNEKQYIINNDNNNENSEEQNYPSNYSYHESKCIKKKKKIIPVNNNTNSNFTILYSTSNNKKSNKSLNKSHAIPNNVNNRYETTNNSNYLTINKNESFYNNIPTKTINSIITTDNKKKNIVLKKIYKMDEIRPFNQSNNSLIKTIVHQPRSSNIFYSNNKVTTPKHNFEKEKEKEKEKSSYKYEKKSYNIPSKSTENITFKKLFSNSKNEKETLHTSKKKI